VVRQARLGDIERILLTRLRYLGDVILTTPTIETFRQAYPAGYVAYLTEADGAAVLEGNPHLDEIIIWQEGLGGQRRCIEQLRRRRFDIVVDLFSNPRSALLTYLAGARWRMGYRRGPRGLLYNLAIETAGEVPAIETHLRAARTLGIEPGRLRTRIYLSDSDRLWGSGFVDAGIEDGSPIIGFFPGGKWPAKRWRLERFVQLASLLVREVRARVFAFFGPHESEDAEPYASMAGGDQSVCRGQTVRELAGIIASCDLLVSNDGGPMHIGPAVGTPTLGILGPTEPQIWFPYRREDGHRLLIHEVDCRPCHRHDCGEPECLDSITVDEVFETCIEMLEARNRSDQQRVPSR
jgi:heptosyltransferase-3